MNWTDIIKFLISVSGVSAVLIYVGKKLIDKTLDAGLEKYKAELSRLNGEHQIRYGKLHEERGEKIRLLYTLIYELEKNLRAFTNFMQKGNLATDTLPSTEVKQSLAAVKEALEVNRIYFSDELCSKIEAIMDKSTTALARMNRAKLIDQGILGQPGEDPTDTWLTADVYVQNEVYQTRLDLVIEFHKLIGVSS
ncbi:MAG: hypothetical protein JWP94_1825 [Mucilaginibacter sp.]|nr:hypothetical protein [Mucilaginibacter sp.]